VPDILTAIEVKLNDLFSPGMAKAGQASNQFAGKTIGALNQVDRALSGTAAKLGALGVTMSLGVAAKGIIELDHRMTRLGLTANASAEQVAHIKQAIYDVAQASDVKLDPTNILSGLEVVMTKTGDLKYAEENIRNIGIAIQASGEAGESIGSVFAEFQKFGYSAKQISSLMDDMVAQSDQGAFTFAEFAKAAPAIFSAYSTIGTAPENIRKANAAMQILVAGTKSPEVAVTALNSAMNELCEPEKQKKLRELGINVRDKVTGEFRDFNDIMFDIVKKAEKMGNADFFGTIFGSISMKAIRSYMTQGERMYENLVNLGDTTGLLQSKAAKMAGTLQSNLQGLQTAFNRFADSNLAKPLEHITNFLNKMAEDPKKVEAVFEAIKRGVISIGILKIGAGLMSFISSIHSLTGGTAKVNITESFSMAQAMPVYVTNWGGAAGGPIGAAGIPGMRPGGLLDQYGNPMAPSVGAPAAPQGKWNLNKPNWKGAAAAGIGAAAITALLSVGGMISELGEIKNNEELTKEERGKAKGGAIGDFAGSVAGAGAGALAGAALGSIIPGVGTIIGALAGGLIGQFGGPLGRMIGEKIGAAVTKVKPENAQEAFDKAQADYDAAVREAGNVTGKTAEEMMKEAKDTFAKADADYAAALQDASDATGKTAEEMDRAYQRLREAGRRWEEAKKASGEMEQAYQNIREKEINLEAARIALEIPRDALSTEELDEALGQALVAFNKAEAEYAAAKRDAAGNAAWMSDAEIEQAQQKVSEAKARMEAAKNERAAISRAIQAQAVFDKTQADYTAAIQNAGDETGKTAEELYESRLKVREIETLLEVAKSELETSMAAISKVSPAQAQAVFEKAQADYAAALLEAGDETGKTAEEIEKVGEKFREAEIRLEAARSVLEMSEAAVPKAGTKQVEFAKAEADYAAIKRDFAANAAWMTNAEIDQAHQRVSEAKARMEAAQSALEMSRIDGFKNFATRHFQSSQVEIPGFMLPPQITRTESGISPPMRADFGGNASIDVNVNVSEERTTAWAKLGNNNIPSVNINPTGNVRRARCLSL